MNDTKSEDTQWTELRRRAELRIGVSPPAAGEADELQRLIHEIRVNQIELEIQNEELRHRHDAIEEAKRNYERLYRNRAALFNFAPIGYLTMDRDGVIGDINLSATIMLNTPRSTLIGRRITDFIHRDDQDGFYYHKLACQKRDDIDGFELKMKRADDDLFDARLQMQLLPAMYAEKQRYSVAFMDVSERVQLSSGFALQQQCLEIASSAHDLQVLIEDYVRVIKKFLKCDAVGIRLLDPEGNFQYKACEGFSRAMQTSMERLSLRDLPIMCNAVIEGHADSCRSCVTPKGSFYINTVSRFLATAPSEMLDEARPVCLASGQESMALVPIAEDETIHGLIHVADHREHIFPLRIVEHLEAVGIRLGLSIQRFHLQAKLSGTVDTLNHLSGHLLKVQEDEQRRIALELHDGCGQDLNVLKLRLKGLQTRLPADAVGLRDECGELMLYADKIIDALRDIAHGLIPAALDALGLSEAAKQIIREFSENTAIDVDMELASLDRITDTTAQVCIFRILQEALTNITKHAQASRITIVAAQQGEDLHISIQDDGKGFDVRIQSESNGADRGMGLSAMALRCRMIHATFSIDSEKGDGTRLTIRVPCPSPQVQP